MSSSRWADAAYPLPREAEAEGQAGSVEAPTGAAHGHPKANPSGSARPAQRRATRDGLARTGDARCAPGRRPWGSGSVERCCGQRWPVAIPEHPPVAGVRLPVVVEVVEDVGWDTVRECCAARHPGAGGRHGGVEVRAAQTLGLDVEQVLLRGLRDSNRCSASVGRPPRLGSWRQMWRVALRAQGSRAPWDASAASGFGPFGGGLSCGVGPALEGDLEGSDGDLDLGVEGGVEGGEARP